MWRGTTPSFAGAQRQIAILDATVRSQRDTLDLAKARFDAGLGAALDVERADGQLDATRSRRPELERLTIRAMYRLDVLLGQQPGTLASTLETPLPLASAAAGSSAVLPSELLSRRPDLRRAEREVAAATARQGVARSDLFPRFSIGGNFGRRSEDVSDLGSTGSQFWFLVAGCTAADSVGRTHPRQHPGAGRATGTGAAAVPEGRPDGRRGSRERAVGSDARATPRWTSLRASVAANRRALDLATDRYTGGLENFLSVLDAQRARLRR